MALSNRDMAVSGVMVYNAKTRKRVITLGFPSVIRVCLSPSNPAKQSNSQVSHRAMNTKQDTLETIVERTAQQVIADEFLIARAKILELAATLDRIERSSGDVEDSKQMNLLAQGMHILCDEEVDKAKRVQLLMSRQYDPQWQHTMSIARKGV